MNKPKGTYVGKRGVIYARFSSHSQSDQSIETQIEIVSNFFATQGIKLVGIYQDKARSARFKTEQRYDLMRLMNDAYKGDFDIVGVYDFKRWFRNEREDIKYENLLNENGIELLSATNPLPEHRLAAKLLRSIGRVINQEESDVLSERVSDGLNTNVANGKMIGGSITWGYKMNNQVKYEINEETAEYVRYVFDSYLSGMTMNEIRESLNKKGITNSSGKPFNHNQHISKILHNDRYIGVFTYKGIKHNDYIPAIISDDTFYKVQEKLILNKGPADRARNKGDYLLSGKLYCGCCNRLMHGMSGTSKAKKAYYYYKCPNDKCSMKNKGKDFIENLVVDVSVKYILEYERLDELVDLIVVASNTKELTDDKIIENLENQERILKQEIKNMIDAIKKGLFSDIIMDELNDSQHRLRMISHELGVAKNKRPLPLERDHVLFWFNHFLGKEIIDESQKRNILDIFIHKVIMTNDEVTISYNISDKSADKSILEINKTVIFYKDGSTKSDNVFAAVINGAIFDQYGLFFPSDILFTEIFSKPIKNQETYNLY